MSRLALHNIPSESKVLQVHKKEEKCEKQFVNLGNLKGVLVTV